MIPYPQRGALDLVFAARRKLLTVGGSIWRDPPCDDASALGSTFGRGCDGRGDHAQRLEDLGKFTLPDARDAIAFAIRTKADSVGDVRILSP